MSEQFKNFAVVEVQHTTFAWGATHMLANFLRQKCVFFMYFQHPFEHFRFCGPRISIYSSGKELKTIELPSFRAPLPLLFLRDLTVTLLCVIGIKKRFHLYVGADPLNAFAGIVLRSMRLVSKTVFYAIDWSPHRFQNKLANSLYHFLLKWVAKRCDFVWSTSDGIAHALARVGVSKQKVSVVPPGVDFDETRTYAKSSPVERSSLVFIGNLAHEKGLQLVIEAMPTLRQICPSATVKIIGTGPYEKALRERARLLEPTAVKFLGHLRNRDEALHLIAQCAIGLATYVPSRHSYSTFAFPGKVIEYMACGLPVIATRTQKFMEQIENNRAGILINYDKKEFVEVAVSLIRDDVLYQQLKTNALKLASQFDYRAIFSKALDQIHLGSE